jgi:CubicO group peptidase (beta-lactamase class C family)
LTTVLQRDKRAIGPALRKSARHAFLGMALHLGAAGPAIAQNSSPPAAVMTAEDLAALFDEHVVREMKKADVAGAAIVVVKDGAVTFARGYGYADVKNKTPVSPNKTLFRIASVSKVVTSTAVMQLVEQGRIDLDADIARYVDFAIPAAFGKPITMRHLMSHTAGFDDTVQGRWVEQGKLGPLRDYLVRQMPRRIFAPGAVPAYSSYGTTLAGYIVEQVSGEAFEAYVQKNIFAPLGMQHSSFAQPLPGHLEPMLTTAYSTGTGPIRPFGTAQAGPATSMSSSAMDMARFMLAHLGAPATPGPSLLRPATLATMHSAQYRHHPDGPAVALGLYEMDEVAPRLIGHVGDIPGFHSAMYLFPEQRTGLFIVQNTETGGTLPNILLKAFAERYLAPQSQPTGILRGVVVDESEQITGSYRSTWRFDSSPLSLKYLLDQSVVRTVRPGTVSVDTLVGLDGEPVEWHQVDSGVWQSTANPLRRLYFRKNGQGDWGLSSNRNPTYILQKSPWHQHKLLILAILPLSLGVALLSVLAWPLSSVLRRQALPQADRPPQALRARNFMRAAGLLTLAPWILYGAIALVVANDLLFVASPACSALLRVVQLLAWLAAAAAIGAVWAAWVSCRTREVGWASRVHHVLLALACVGATAIAWQGGLLIWNGRF